MAIDNVNVIDGMGVDPEKRALRLLLTDHLPWENSLSEYEHLNLLQKKINSYLAFLEGKQYMKQYPGLEVDMAVIEAHFKYEIPENCEKFLQSAQEQVRQNGIEIEVHIG